MQHLGQVLALLQVYCTLSRSTASLLALYRLLSADLDVKMAGPTVELFSTSILSNVKVRTRHERYTSVLAIKKIPYVYHDLASDEDAKSRWRRKTKDPQLPGILVNNEWVGSYDDFEEAVEFGELELFLGVSPATAPTTPPAPHPAQSAVSSKDPSLYPTLPYAAEGAGRWKEPDADDFISSLNIKEDELTDADVDAMLADIGKLPSAPTSSTTSDKKYVPSKEAAIKPLRFAKMGPTTSHQRMPSASPSPSSASAGVRASPIARYSATQRSTRALAAEAAALTSNRKTSGALLRDAVSQGKNLDDAMEQSRIKQIVSEDNIDDLFASLGLSNVDIGDDEVDQFLEQGEIPQGLRLGGDRVHRSTSIADKARDQTVARDLARKAREKGHSSARSSLSNVDSKLAGLEPANVIGLAADESSADVATTSESTSLPSLQGSAGAEVTSSEGANAESDETNQPLETSTDLLDTRIASECGQNPDQAPLVEAVEDKTRDSSAATADSANRDTATEQQELETVSNQLVTAESKAAEVETVDGKALQKSVLTAILSTSESQEIGQVEQDDKDTAEEPTAVESTVDASNGSEVDADSHQRASEVPTTEEGLTSKDDDESNAPVKAADKDQSNGSNSNKIDTSASSSAETESKSVPTIVQEEKLASHDESVDAAGSNKIGEDLTPTKDTVQDPLKTADSSRSEALPIASRETDGSDVDAAFENELAQAALIASRFEDRKTAFATDTELAKHSEAVADNIDVTGPADPAATATASATSPVRSSSISCGLESMEREDKPRDRTSSAAAGQRRTSSSQQASSSSRRVIDVPRPIDPATAVLHPSIPPHNLSDSSPSPDTMAKKKKMGILGFGRDKNKDKDKDKDTASGKKATPSEWRQERTISQILREADAVLQSDDYQDGSHKGDDDDVDTADSAMVFGVSSIDIEAASIPALRNS